MKLEYKTILNIVHLVNAFRGKGNENKQNETKVIYDKEDIGIKKDSRVAMTIKFIINPLVVVLTQLPLFLLLMGYLGTKESQMYFNSLNIIVVLTIFALLGSIYTKSVATIIEHILFLFPTFLFMTFIYNNEITINIFYVYLALVILAFIIGIIVINKGRKTNVKKVDKNDEQAIEEKSTISQKLKELFSAKNIVKIISIILTITIFVIYICKMDNTAFIELMKFITKNY